MPAIHRPNVEQTLAYRISWEIYTPYTGDSGMLLHTYGKKLKSSCLSYNWVVSFPTASMFNKTSKYEAEVGDSVVSLKTSLRFEVGSWQYDLTKLFEKAVSLYSQVNFLEWLFDLYCKSIGDGQIIFNERPVNKHKYLSNIYRNDSIAQLYIYSIPV
jgi:hypothetical protein